ncbi:MAG: hypothetical protein ABSE73_25100 [Planctomycetota bacterium]
MTFRGRISGGLVVLEHPLSLPEGTEVKVQPVKKRGRSGEKQDLSDKLLQWAGKCKGLPSDLARNHDHYLHGGPKRDD